MMRFLYIFVILVVQILPAITDDTDEWFEAVKAGDTATVENLLSENGTGLLSRKTGGRTAIHIASGSDHTDLIRLLIDSGANIQAPDLEGKTPLHYAAAYGSSEAVQKLINASADIDAKSYCWDDKGTPLHYAVRYGSSEAVQLLIDAGANMETSIDSEGTPLQYAAAYGSSEVVQMLIDAGANIEAIDGEKTPLHYAAEYGSSEVLQTLLNAGANISAVNGYCETALHLAAENNEPDTVQMLINAGVNVDAKDYAGDTALHRAARWWTTQSENVLILIDAGADIEAVNNDRETPLHVAASYGRNEIVQMLIVAGADIETRNDRGSTALILAVNTYRGGGPIQTLLAAGANVEAINNEGETALHKAAHHGLYKAVQRLIDEGADIEIKNDDGSTALFLAASSDVPYMYAVSATVQTLLAAGANIEAKNYAGETVLHIDAKHAFTDGVQLLIDVGANVEAKNNDGDTAVDLALKKITDCENLEYWTFNWTEWWFSCYKKLRDFMEIVLLLINAGAKADITKLLDYCKSEQDIDFIQKLVKSEKVLPMAVETTNINGIEFLIEKGKLIEIYNSTGSKTLLYWALLNSSMEVLQMEDIDWNAHIEYDQSRFNPIDNSKVVLQSSETTTGNASKKEQKEKKEHEGKQPEIVYCTDLAPGLKRFASGIDITTLDLFPLDSTKTDGFKRSLLDYTCNKGRNWKDDDNVLDIPDQLEDFQRMSTGWTHANVEILRSRDEVKYSMSENVQLEESSETNINLKTPRFSLLGIDIGSFNLKTYESKCSFSRSDSVRKISEDIEKRDKTIAKATAFISIYKAVIDPESHFEPNQPLRSAIDELPSSVNYYNMHFYLDFIKEYGTHYFAEAKFGGYLMQLSAISSDYTSEHSDEHLKQKEAQFFQKQLQWLNEEKSDYSEKIEDQTEAHEEFKKNVEQKMYFYGGDPEAKNLEWFESVSGSPWLFSGKLEPIYNLIKDEQKQLSMKIALVAYMKNARAAELGPRFDAEICAYAFGNGCSAPRDNCARVNQWTVPVTFREGSGSQCRMNWKLKVAAPDDWIEERVKLCFKYFADTNSTCSGSNYHPSWQIETPDKVKTLLSNAATDDANALINCADVNDWTSNYIHYNGEGCTMTWSMFAVGNEGDDIPEWMEEFYFCWRTLNFDGKVTIDCAPVMNRYLSHFQKEGGQLEGRQMEWGLFAQDLSTET